MKDLLLITIDCLRADHLGCYGYSRSITPNIDRIAEKATLFDQVITHCSHTSQAVPSLITSSYPFHPRRKNLAQVLRAHGYTTASFHSNPFFSTRYGIGEGFETFEDTQPLKNLPPERYAKLKKRLEKHKSLFSFTRGSFQLLRRLKHATKSRRMPYSEAEFHNRRALSWLKNRDKTRNFFLWVHYLDPHLPYNPPPRFLKKLNPHLTRKEVKKLNEMVKLKNQGRIGSDEIEEQEVKKLVDLYDAEISYTDYAIGELLSEMESLGALEDTCIAISADHGEEFMEHGGFTHGNKLYEEVVKVPLIISSPGIAPSSKEHLGGLVDLAPTLLDLLELPREPLFQGRSVLEEGRKRVLCETHSALACRTRDQKYIRDKRTGEVEHYNLATDPGENENLGEGPDSRYFEKAINTYLLKKSTLSTLQRAREKITPKEPQSE